MMSAGWFEKDNFYFILLRHLTFFRVFFSAPVLILNGARDLHDKSTKVLHQSVGRVFWNYNSIIGGPRKRVSIFAYSRLSQVVQITRVAILSMVLLFLGSIYLSIHLYISIYIVHLSISINLYLYIYIYLPLASCGPPAGTSARSASQLRTVRWMLVFVEEADLFFWKGTFQEISDQNRSKKLRMHHGAILC